jgi:hypothetical protein
MDVVVTPSAWPAARAAHPARDADPFGLLTDLDMDLAAAVDTAFARRAVPPGAAPDTCSVCGTVMGRRSTGFDFYCDSCGLVREGASDGDEQQTHPAATTRLRIVGPGSNQLQPDLYRAGASDTTTAQKKQITEEYRRYRQMFIDCGGRAFPINACECAAEYYNEVQKRCVKRSQNKKLIMAACFWLACIHLKFAPERKDVAQLMQLDRLGFAAGENFIRELVASDRTVAIDIDEDHCMPEINTIFAKLGYVGDDFNHLRDAVYDIVQTAIRNNIGTNSILHSKVAGATYVVLLRSRSPLVRRIVPIQDFCTKYNIRKNTIERFIRCIADYHSYFAQCYVRYELTG